MEDRTAVITLRIEPSYKAAFEKLASDMDRTTSQMLRGFIRNAVEQHQAANQQQALDLGTQQQPKPKKGQKLAAACAKNVRQP